MKKKKPTIGKVSNRRARYDYELGDSLVVGISLTGAETKALRSNHGDLTSAYVQIKDDELWLIGARIFGSNVAPIDELDQSRSRKLLAKTSEIKKLAAARQEGRSIIPLELITSGRYIKLRIAPGRGKKRYDKRQTIKQREQDREVRKKMS